MPAITTIVHFEVPIEHIDTFLSDWYENQKLMEQQPGMLGGILHRAIDPAGPFQLSVPGEY